MTHVEKQYQCVCQLHKSGMVVWLADMNRVTKIKMS